ncbi:MAG: Fic family protein [Thermoleophilaceae bacterium]|nr:Fic family protein [Thermoleophilaceae bacterium]
MAEPKRPAAGRYEPSKDSEGTINWYLPNPVGAFDSEFEPSRNLQLIIGQAHRALGKLEGLFVRAEEPDQRLILTAYLRKEAVLSSQIEGTQSSLSEVLEYESDQARGGVNDDAAQTLNYSRALEYGIASLESGELPICGRLIRELHSRLLSGTRGGEKDPGNYRSQGVRIGGESIYDASFVPPPPQHVPELITDLETYINDAASEQDPLIVAGVAHYQFETVHPFFDGNGRVGRMLIPLILLERGVLPTPSLYVSLYFKRNRDDYYAALQAVRDSDDWERWLQFFMRAIVAASESVFQTTRRLEEQIKADRSAVASLAEGRHAIVKVFEHFSSTIVSDSKLAQAQTGLSAPAAHAGINSLEDWGYLAELSGRKRNRVYGYMNYVKILQADD